VTCDPVTQDASWQDETLQYKAELVVVAEVIAEVIRKRKYQEEIMEQEQSGKKIYVKSYAS